MHLAVQFGWLSISSPPQVTRWPWPSWQSARGRASEVPLPADLLGTHLVNEMQSMCIRLYLSGFQQTWPHGASRPLKSLRRHRGRSASFPVACSDCIVCIITCFKASGCERLCGCGHRRVGRGSAAVGALDFPVHRRGHEKSRRRADFPICFFFSWQIFSSSGWMCTLLVFSQDLLFHLFGVCFWRELLSCVYSCLFLSLCSDLYVSPVGCWVTSTVLGALAIFGDLPIASHLVNVWSEWSTSLLWTLLIHQGLN